MAAGQAVGNSGAVTGTGGAEGAGNASFLSTEGGSNLKGKWSSDKRGDVQKILDPGAFFLKGKKKFKPFILPDIKQLTAQAMDNFSENQGKFLSDQLAAQRSQFGDFFDLQAQGVEQGRSLIDKLTTGDLERRFATEGVRSAQAARGLSLSPAAAIQEGLAVSGAQRDAEMQALGLTQQMAQFSASTPLQLQQLDIGQLLSMEGQRSLAQAGLSTDAQISNINMQRDEDTKTMALLGRAAGAFANRDKTPTATGTAPNTNYTGYGGDFDPGRYTPPSNGTVGPDGVPDMLRRPTSNVATTTGTSGAPDWFTRNYG